MHYVGIDWGDQEHYICIMSEDGHALSEFVVKHNWEGFEQLQDALSQLGELEINLERPDGLLVDWLVSQKWSVFVTQPKILARRRPRLSKDDRGDAYLLANLRRLKDEDSRPIVTHSETVDQLRQLTRAYNQLAKQQTSTANQLRQVLKAYYPAAIEIFARLTGPVTLAFLRTYPNPEAAKAVSKEALITFFREHHYNYPQRTATKYKQLQQPAPTARVSAGYIQHMLALVAILETLHLQIYQIKRQIESVFETHPEASWWRSFPGAGLLTAPTLLARIGDNREQFPSSEALQATAGTVPVTRRSGQQTNIFFRRYCSHPLRDATMNLAKNSIRQSGWARSYFYDQLALGHHKARAYRALANRWLRIIWTLWQRHENYDETRHVANRSRRGVNSELPVSKTEILRQPSQAV